MSQAMTTFTATAATNGDPTASMPRTISKTPHTIDHVEACRTTSDELSCAIETSSKRTEGVYSNKYRRGNNYERSFRLVLLLVVHRRIAHFLAVSAGSVGGYRAAFAVGRGHDGSTQDDLIAALDSDFHHVVIHFNVRPGSLVRVAGNGIIFTVEFAGPLGVSWLTVKADAVNRDFHAVARSFVRDHCAFRRARAKLRFGF